MKTNSTIDTAKLGILLNELRLPAIKLLWPKFAEQADKEGWPAARFLTAIAEHELAERDRRRIERHLAEAHLLPGKTLDTFEFEAVPMISRALMISSLRAITRSGRRRFGAATWPLQTSILKKAFHDTTALGIMPSRSRSVVMILECALMASGRSTWRCPASLKRQ